MIRLYGVLLFVASTTILAFYLAPFVAYDPHQWARYGFLLGLLLALIEWVTYTPKSVVVRDETAYMRPSSPGSIRNRAAPPGPSRMPPAHVQKSVDEMVEKDRRRTSPEEEA